MSVVLPAPFSPSNPWISPRAAVKSTPSRATVSPNRLAMSDIWTRSAMGDGGALRRLVDDFRNRLAGHDLFEDRARLVGDARRHVADVRQLHAAAGAHLVVAGALALEDLPDDLVIGLVEVEHERDGQVLRGEIPLLRVEGREQHRARRGLDGLDDAREAQVHEDDDEVRARRDLGLRRLPRLDGIVEVADPVVEELRLRV